MSLRKYINVIKNNPIASIWVFFHGLHKWLPLDYYFLGEYSFFPDCIIILITDRCNFACDRCSAKSRADNETYNELSIQELKKIIDQLSFIKPFIYFSGGEPLLREDVFELIHYIKSKHMLTGLVSNGSFLNEGNVNKIIDSRLDFFSVSIDGPREYHDKVRGFQGAFDKAVNGLKLLIETRKKRRISHPHIKIVGIIEPSNFDNSIFVIDLANELGVDELNLGNLMFYAPGIKDKLRSFKDETGLDISFINGKELKEDYDFAMNREKLKKFLDYAKKSSKIPIAFNPPKADFINHYTFKDPSPGSRCQNPWSSVTILPDGKVVPCQGLILGNIKEDKLKTLWNNEKIRKFRRIRKQSQPPFCFRCCEGQIFSYE